MGSGRSHGSPARPALSPAPRCPPQHKPADTPRPCLLTEYVFPPRGLLGPHGTKERACTEQPSVHSVGSGANHTGATESPRVQERPQDQRGWAAVQRA